MLAGTFMPSVLRLAVWRLLGFKVGPGSHVSILSIVVAGDIEIGPGAVIDPLTLIYRPTLLHLGERSRIATFVRIIGHQGSVRLRPQSFVGLGTLIDSTAGFELGDRSQLGPRCTVYSHGGCHLFYNVRYPYREGKVTIGSDSWIGMGCVIQAGAEIGSRSIVFSGLAVRGPVADDTSVVPVQPEHRTVSTSRLTIGVTPAEQMPKIEALLRVFADEEHGRLDERAAGRWRLELPGGRAICLLRQPAPGDENEAPGGETLVWTLPREGRVEGKTCFCFETLGVSGPWTPFAEKVAAFLCLRGPQFIFEDRSRQGNGAPKA